MPIPTTGSPVTGSFAKPRGMPCRQGRGRGGSPGTGKGRSPFHGPTGNWSNSSIGRKKDEDRGRPETGRTRRDRHRVEGRGGQHGGVRGSPCRGRGNGRVGDDGRQDVEQPPGEPERLLHVLRPRRGVPRGASHTHAFPHGGFGGDAREDPRADRSQEPREPRGGQARGVLQGGRNPVPHIAKGDAPRSSYSGGTPAAR